MEALVAAIALVFVVGVALPASTDAKLPDKAQRWGVRLLARTDFEGQQDPNAHDVTLYASGFLNVKRVKGSRPPDRFYSVRISLWRYRPTSKWDKKLVTRTFRNPRVFDRPPDRVNGFATPDYRCDQTDPRFGQYYAKVRIKRMKQSKPLWLRSELRSPTYEWDRCLQGSSAPND